MTRPLASVPRLALTLDEAAAALGVSRDHLERHVLPDGLRIVRSGRRIMVRPAEIDRWLAAREHVQ